MKKFLSRAALGVAAAGVFALASCNGTPDPTTTEEKPTTTTPEPTTTVDDSVNEAAKKLLANLIFEADGTAVTGDVSLPAYLASGDTQVTIHWESDSELVKVGTTIDEEKGAFTGAVSRPEDKAVTVTLTASITFAGGEAQRQFTVLVNPYSVSDAIDSFTFTYNGGTVEKDFEVPTSFKFNNQDVTIAWSIPDSSKELLSVDADGKTIHVVQQAKREKAQIKAEFTYKGETLSRNYRLNVFHVRTALELLHTFYDDPGAEAYTLKGYVAHKAGYDASYGNGYLYIVDQTLEGGYYVYRAYCDQATWDSLAIGTAVEIPSCKSTEYNGLIEVGQNKENIVKVSTELPALTADQLALVTNGLAADQLFVRYSQGDKELMYHTGQRVNLTSWKVVEIDATTTAKSGGVLATLEKAGVRVNVQLSKYAATLDGDIAKAAASQVKTLKVGDFVNVTGILSNYNGYCIYVSDETTFTKTADDANASLGELKDLVDPVFAALDKFPDTITEVFNLDKTTITTAEGVTLDIIASELGNLEGNVFTITPTTEEKTIKVTIRATKNDVSYSKEIEIYTRLTTVEEKVAKEKEDFKLEIDEFGVHTLDTNGATFAEVAISYTTESPIASINENKLTILSVDADTTVTITVTFTCDTIVATKTVELTIKNKPRYQTDNVEVTAPAADKVYFLGLKQNSLGQVLYANGTIGSNRLNTTPNAYEATTVTAEASEGKYAFKFANGKYLSLTSAGKLDFADEAFYWTYDTELHCWKATAGTTDYFFGTYNNYNTISASKTSYLPGANQYIGNLYLATPLTKTKDEKVKYELAKIESALKSKVDSGETITLPTVGGVFEDVKAVYALTSAKGATIDGGKITFDTVGALTTLNFTVTLTCGDASVVKNFSVDVKPVEFLDVTAAIAAATEGENIYIQGVVASINATATTPYCWITDGENDFEVYGAVVAGSPLDYKGIKVGDVIQVSGKYTVYNGTKETARDSATIHAKLEATDAQKVMMTARELTDLDDIQDNVVNRQLATAGTVYNDVAISWAVKGGDTATVSITDNKLTATQTDVDQEVTLVATITKGEETSSKEVKVTVKKVSATKTKTIAYTSDTATTLKAEIIDKDYADVLGLDTSIFDIKFTKGSANEPALYKNSIRLYGNEAGGNVMTISCVEGYRIDSVVLTYDTSKTGGTATVNTTAIAAISKDHTTDTVNFAEAENVKSVVITNTSTSTSQFRIASIVITYTKIA